MVAGDVRVARVLYRGMKDKLARFLVVGGAAQGYGNTTASRGSPHSGVESWWRVHTECFSQERHLRQAHGAKQAEPKPKKPWLARPEVSRGVLELITEVGSPGWRLVYTDGWSKRLVPDSKDRAGGFGVNAPEDEQGPEVCFCGYVLVKHRQTNNAAELWVALEALQGFWVPKLAVLTDSQYF